MQRRDFLKISAITGASAALDACGKPDNAMIRFLPEDDLVPGIATYKPGVCTLCAAGCGLTVRVMEGDAEVVRNGKAGVVSMGLAKKLEGNPSHPVNRGRLCPRGQAGIQVAYHPDRVKNPLRRSGAKGSGQFQEVSWEDAAKELVSHLSESLSSKDSAALALLTRPLRGQRGELVRRFAGLFDSSPIFYQPVDDQVLRHANFISFGKAQLPTFDFARTNFVVSFGADFLGVWNSPVSQAVGYGEMRQGRPGNRAGFVQIEQRMSLTGASADQWLTAKPGSEGVLALGIAHVLMAENLQPKDASGASGSIVGGWSQGLPNYTPEEVAKRTGVPAKIISQLARDMASHTPAVAVIAGAPLACSNGFFNAIAVNALNALLGNLGKPGGISFTPQPTALAPTPAAQRPPAQKEAVSNLFDLIRRIQNGSPPKVLLLYGANPVFGAPTVFGVRDALLKVPFIASLGSFVDETSALADLILPDHSPLESWVDEVPESGALVEVLSLAPPAMLPLHNTRAMPDVLLDIARQLPGSAATSLPWKTYDAMLKEAVLPLRPAKGSADSPDPEAFWKEVQMQGGWWGSEMKAPTSAVSTKTPAHSTFIPDQIPEPEFAGDQKEFPFYFQPFASQMFDDGSLAHLPWLQEAPDPLSTTMWNSWVEINPKTAQTMNIQQGDLVEIASPNGKLQAQALISPGIAPDVIAMPIGQGHENFTRYATGLGANPLSILAPIIEPETGALAWAATRVRISRLAEGKLTVFAGGLSRFPFEHEER